MVVNVPVVDATPANGSTELWPGTHLDTTRALNDGDIKLPPAIEERLRAECKPLQPNVPAGSVLIRDMRLWHRGMPNLTEPAPPDDRHDPLGALVAHGEAAVVSQGDRRTVCR